MTMLFQGRAVKDKPPFWEGLVGACVHIINRLPWNKNMSHNYKSD